MFKEFLDPYEQNASGRTANPASKPEPLCDDDLRQLVVGWLVDAFLDRVPEGLGQTIRMHLANNFDTNATSLALGVSPGAVRLALARFIAKCQQLLAQGQCELEKVVFNRLFCSENDE